MRTTGIRGAARTWTKLASVVAFLTVMSLGVSQSTPAAHLVRSAHADDGEPFFEAAERGRSFSERDIRGPYGFFFQGFVTVTLPDDSTVSVPVSAIGHLVADGSGALPDGSRTLNLGGVLLEQVTTVDQIGSLPPGLSLPPTTLETFSFVLTNRAGGIPFIARSIVDAGSEEPVGAVTIRGEAHSQR